MKKVLSILLTLAMITVLLAGCGNSSSNGEASNPIESSTEISSTESVVEPETESEAELEALPEDGEQAEAQEDTENEDVAVEDGESSSPAPALVEYSLPLFEDTFSFSMFWPIPGGPDSAAQSDVASYPFWQSVLQQLNVNIDFQRTAEASTAEKYNLMIASGDMTDVVIQGRDASYSTGLDAAVLDEVYVDLMPYLEEFAPNYSLRLNSSEEVTKELTTAGGRVVVISAIYDKPSGVSQGLLVGKEQLEATGMDNSDVVEDWIEIFRAMKQNGTAAPAATTPSGNCGNNAFYYAYGTTGASTFMVDLATNDVYYDPISDGFRDYLEFFRQMYSEGLIDKDFYNTFGMEFFLDGTYGTWMGNYQDLTSFPVNFGVEVYAVAPLHLQDSKTGEPKTTDYSSFVQMTAGESGACITTSCNDVEDVLKFFDWFYSEEGSNRANYGFEEGVSYEVLPDGSYQLMPEMLDRDPVTMTAGRGMYTLIEGWGYLITGVQLAVESADAVAANELWSSADPDKAENMALPSLVSLTADESTEVSQIMSDIETYFNTMLMRWYTCEDDLNDETWAAYIKTLKDMNIDRAVEIYSDAYVRYQNK